MTSEADNALVEELAKVRRTIWLRMNALEYLDSDSLDQLIDTFFPDVFAKAAADAAAVLALVNDYLDADGSRGVYHAFKLFDAREKLEAAIRAKAQETTNAD